MKLWMIGLTIYVVFLSVLVGYIVDCLKSIREWMKKQ